MLSPKTLIQALLGLLTLGTGYSLYAEDDQTKVLDLNQVDMEQVDDNWENTSQVPKVRADNGLKIKDIVEPTSEYTYASFGKPDPFTRPLFGAPPEETGAALAQNPGDAVPGSAPGSKEITVNSPLQAYPLTALEVKGVWQTQDGEFRSIIQTPKKEGVVVKNGDPISSGKILTIGKDEILVRLYKLKADGVREYEDTSMTFGDGTKVSKATIKLEPGKEAQFPGMEEPADGAANAAPKPVVSPPKAPAAAKPEDKKNAAAAPAAGADAATKPAAENKGPGWPYNTGPATPAPAPTSGRPGANLR